METKLFPVFNFQIEDAFQRLPGFKSVYVVEFRYRLFQELSQ